jgi:uncharacterized membrane protein YuzA (DUF378 family)
MKKNKEIMKWVNLISFGVLISAGFVCLLMGLFNFNLISAIFGNSVVARIFYSLFGISSIVLLTTILLKAFMTTGKKEQITKSISSAVPSSSSTAK